MIKKKFKVRVKHFDNGYYVIQYSYHYIIPFYFDINHWSGRLIGDMEGGWFPVLRKYKDAEIFAKRFKCIKDIENWYKSQREIKKDFFEKKKEHYKNNIPYKTKYIN